MPKPAMNLDASTAIVLRLLKRQGRAKNSESLELLGGDEALFEQVRESLIFDDLARDKHGVGLVYVESGPQAKKPPSNDNASQSAPQRKSNRPSNGCPRGGSREKSPGSEPAANTQRTSFAASVAPTAPMPHQRVPPAAQQEFFLWEAGSESGPVSLSELQARVADGRLSPQEFVKQGLAGDWIPAGKIAGLLDSPQHNAVSDDGIDIEAMLREMPSDLAGGIPKDDTIQPPRPPKDSFEARHPPQARETRSAVDAWSETRPALQSSTSKARTPTIASRSPRRHTQPLSPWQWFRQRSPRCLGTAILVGIALLAYAYWPISERRVFDDYLDVWTEMKALRSQAASADEWAEFERRSKLRLEPTLRRLERVARSDRPAKQELLWAGRFCLWKMLDSRGRHSSEMESNFVKHLERVERIWNGEDDDGLSRLAASPPVEENAGSAESVGGQRRLGATIPPGAAGYRPPDVRWRSGP